MGLTASEAAAAQARRKAATAANALPWAEAAEILALAYEAESGQPHRSRDPATGKLDMAQWYHEPCRILAVMLKTQHPPLIAALGGGSPDARIADVKAKLEAIVAGL